jgi:mannan endo-1,4-beta-mannosidase
MKHSISLGIWILLATASAHAQSVNFTIDTQKDTLAISPYIYGSNGQSDDTSAHVTARRLGGNRLTGYNWENNASNAGTDYLNHSDNYLTFDLANSLQNTPAIVPIQFHQESQKEHAYSLVTLPAAGYVARDKSGTVAANEVAPSKRWCQVVFSKQAPFDAPPDTTDNFVYDNEEVHYLIGQLGSSDKGGIQGYDCDNEPALWPSTHPRIHPSPTTCAEVIARDSALAVSVKSVDPKAEIFGPVSYGFAEFTNNQTAADWSKYQSYGRWIDAYLAKMHDASTIVGKRLLDVLDLHWYPEAQGIDAGGKRRHCSRNRSGTNGCATNAVGFDLQGK